MSQKISQMKIDPLQLLFLIAVIIYFISDANAAKEPETTLEIQELVQYDGNFSDKQYENDYFDISDYRYSDVELQWEELNPEAIVEWRTNHNFDCTVITGNAETVMDDHLNCIGYSKVWGALGIKRKEAEQFNIYFGVSEEVYDALMQSSDKYSFYQTKIENQYEMKKYY